MNARSNLSRACTWLIALALLVQLVCPLIPAASAEAATVTQSTDVVMGFDAWASLDGRLAQDGDPVTVELIAENGSDKAVKMTVGTPSSGGANVGLVPDVTDWNGGAGLQMHVKNLSDTAVMAISPRFFCYNTSNQQDFMLLQHGATYSLVSGETVTAAASSYGFVMLPAGFEGYVRMPFTSFAGAWYGTQPANLNLAGGGLIYTSFDTINFGGAVVIDDVSVIKANQMANLEDFHTWIANAATADANIGAELVNNGSHGMALKMTINSAGSYSFVNLAAPKANWSGNGALQLYAKNLTSGVLHVQPRFNAGTEQWQIAAGTSLRYVQNGKVTEFVTDNGFVQLPEGFEGYVQIPFTGFIGGWYGSPNTALDLSNVTAMPILFYTDAGFGHVGKSLIVDEFHLLPALSEVTPEPKMVETFEAWTGTTNVVLQDACVGTELVENGSYGKSLKMTVNSAGGYSFAYFVPTVTNWKGGTVMQMYIKNQSNESIVVQPMFYAWNGSGTDQWLMADDTIVQYVQNGVVTEAATAYGFLILPGGFEGYVQIPFSGFRGVYGSTYEMLDLSQTGGIFFNFDVRQEAGHVGKSILVDNIEVLPALSELKPAVAQIGNVPYASVQAAADAASATDIVKLLSDSKEEVTVAEGKTLNLDLNGKNLKKVTVNGTFNGMDTTTDGYDCTNGYGKIGAISGDYSKNHRIQVGNNGQWYVAAEENDGISFHRFYVGITHMALRPGVGGAGYTMTLAGDEMVKTMLNADEAYGYTVYLKDENGEAIEGASITCSGAQADFAGGKQKMEALTINNILKAGAENNADRATKYQIAVEAFVKFGDTTVTGVAPAAMTFKQIVEATDAGLAGRELSEAEKDALLDLYDILVGSQITDWNIPNIEALAEA